MYKQILYNTVKNKSIPSSVIYLFQEHHPLAMGRSGISLFDRWVQSLSGSDLNINVYVLPETYSTQSMSIM